MCVCYDIQVDSCSQLNEYMKLFEYQRSRPFIGPNLSDSVFLNFFSSKTTRTIKAKCHVRPPWDGGTKAYSNGPGHMTKMATIQYMVKTFKNILLWNLNADDLETWSAASSTRLLPSMFK